MASEKTKTISNKKNLAFSIAWLLEATFRGFVGWLLLSNFNHPVVMAAAVYSLATCAMIVVKHFVDAKK